MDRVTKVRFCLFLFGYIMGLTGAMIAIVSDLTQRASQSVGVWMIVLGLVVSRLARKKGIVVYSIMAGLLIVTSAARLWPLGLVLTVAGIAVSRFVRKQSPFAGSVQAF